MTKIFQLELFIKELTVWKMPTGRPGEEIVIEITVFDCKNVPIKRHGFGGNGRGQNFLFTLNGIPTDANQVFFNIFRITNKKKLVGTGNIPIQEVFGDVFLETFKAPEMVQQPQDSGDGQGSAGATNSTKTAKNYSKSGQFQKQQSTKDSATKNDSKSPCSPISKLTKDVYPIIGTDTKQCGIVCILMRLTSFGNSSAHPIHIHQNHKEIIIQNTQNSAMYRRVPLDELRNNRHSDEFRFISAFPNNVGREELIYDKGPDVKDFNFQCTEKDILKDILQTDNSLVAQENIK